MREFSLQIEIAASPRRVWEVLADVERWPDWTESMREILPLQPGPLGTGAKVRIKQPMLPPAVWEITAWEPEKRFVWVSRGLGFSVAGTHSIEPKGAGCVVTLATRLEGPLGGLIGSLSKGMTERYVPMEAAGLKKRAEAGI